MFGDVGSLSAEISQGDNLEIEVESRVEAILNFVNGPTVSVHLNYDQRPARHDLEIVGSEGTLRWDNASGAAYLWTAEQQDWKEYPAPEDFERNHLFMSEMEHFMELVDHQGQSVCSLEDGVRALQIALAVMKAGKSGNRISIDLDRI
jgi:predicted dehydrogenase